MSNFIRQAAIVATLMFCAVSCRKEQGKKLELSNKAVAAYNTSTAYFTMSLKNIKNRQMRDSLESLGTRYRFVADSLQIEYLKLDVK